MNLRQDVLLPSLIASILRGAPLTSWCRESGVPYATAQYWCRSPEIKSVIEAHKSNCVEKISKYINDNLEMAISKIKKIADSGESEEIQLKASLILLQQWEKFAGVSYQKQIEELKAQISGNLGLEEHDIKIQKLEDKIKELEERLENG